MFVVSIKLLSYRLVNPQNIVVILYETNLAYVLQVFREFFGVFVPRREKEGMLSDAIQSFKEALEIDNNQQTARDHLEKIQLQIKVKEQVRDTCLLT